MTKWGSPVLASNLHCCTPASRLQVLQRGRSCIPPPLTITSHYHLHLTDWAPAVSLAAATPAVVPQGPETSLTQLPGLVREGPLSRMGFDSHPGKWISGPAWHPVLLEGAIYKLACFPPGSWPQHPLSRVHFSEAQLRSTMGFDLQSLERGVMFGPSVLGKAGKAKSLTRQTSNNS